MIDQPLEIVFGPYLVDIGRRTLRRGQRLLEVGGRALDILIILARAEGKTVSRQALLDHVWPGLTIEDNNLYVQISTLRKILGDGWIVTVPRRGYRLVDASAAGTPVREAAEE